MQENRESQIVRISLQGMAVNIALVIFKGSVGFLSHSISVLLDALNNLSDVFSQVVTIVGTKLSTKQPDKKHPYGYGRLEYVSAAIVASLVLVAGFHAAKQSLEAIVHPDPAHYSDIALLIIGVGVFAKLFLGLYVKKAGNRIHSDALIAMGTDSLMDSILTFATFATAIITRFFGIYLESYLGLILSIFVLRAGFEIFGETINSLIGGRTDSEISLNIKKKIRGFQGVLGAYDLILHDYGPARSIGSVHIEVPADMTADQIHLLTKRIIADIKEEFGIVLTVGIYATNTDQKILQMKEKAIKICRTHEFFMQLHGFFVDEERKIILFDTLISYKAPQAVAVAESIKVQCQKEFPGYTIVVNIDHDFSD